MNRKLTFALYFGNRGFFPASLIASARKELVEAVEKQGHNVLIMDEAATRYGAVETKQEGDVYAAWLASHRGEYQGVILSLPNFGDENGAVAALKNAGVPILLQAYPDELDKMSPELRRDSFCGKFSIMDVFFQHQIAFTTFKPHTSHPSGEVFARQLADFAAVCRVVNSVKGMRVGMVGARTSPFKTVRTDELTLERHGVTVETFDMSEVIARTKALAADDAALAAKLTTLKNYTGFKNVPAQNFENIARLAVVFDQIVVEGELQAIAVRCWIELQKELGISPCVLLSEMNDRGVVAACETDVANAVAMYALQQASASPATLLDWNNNYEDQENKCIVFHCGPVPQSMMVSKGEVVDHSILLTTVGPGCSYGCNVGRIRPMDVTYGGLLTENGKVKMYLGEGKITGDKIPADFFGCAGVLETADLQNTLYTIGYQGHRHHVAMTQGHLQVALLEALSRYLGFEVTTV
ncbi:MAG: L-fucose/L-arabinose isomerase family protein [Armatimonadota bacterium]